MRILFVNDRCNYFGGVEQNIADTSAGLRALGHETTLAYGWDSGRGSLEQHLSHFDHARACRELGATSPAESFQTIVDSFRPDAIYVHRIPSFAPFVPYLDQTRMVRVIHDHDICCPTSLKYYRLSGKTCCHAAGWRCWLDTGFLERSPDAPLGFKYASIGRKLREMRRSFNVHAVAVDSHFMRDELIQNGFPSDRVHVLPHIVRLPAIQPTPVPATPNLLYVGQLIRSKGIDVFLKSLARVACPFQATIIGTGNGEATFRRLSTRLGLVDRVHFAGWMDRENLDSHYRNAKIVVVPSRWPEPFGMVGLEAMNYGRPTVAFDVGGISDWLAHGETGLLVPEQDIAALAEALESLLADTARAAQFGAAARARVETCFSFDQYVREVEAILAG
jgi:glycosyltransferase involved in cell wall biosynthesis